jgi:hypothetical protein
MAYIGYDIFSGSRDHGALWVDFAEDFESAKRRMEELARLKPGKYFIYSAKISGIMQEIDTSALKQSSEDSVR